MNVSTAPHFAPHFKLYFLKENFRQQLIRGGELDIHATMGDAIVSARDRNLQIAVTPQAWRYLDAALSELTWRRVQNIALNAKEAAAFLIAAPEDREYLTVGVQMFAGDFK